MDIGVRRDEAWLLVGDFNELMSNDDKLGGAVREDSMFWGFGDMATAAKSERCVALVMFFHGMASFMAWLEGWCVGSV